jgi:ABC-type multidrug transport system fused ATPase/permease subunit
MIIPLIDTALKAVSSLGNVFKCALDKIPDGNEKIELQKAHDAELSAAAMQAATLSYSEKQAEIELLKKQIDVNLAQASTSNIFISGARPFATWLITFTVSGISVYLAFLTSQHKDIGAYFEVYFALLTFLGALFGIHTVERHKGVAPEQPDGPNVPSPIRPSDFVTGKLPRA